MDAIFFRSFVEDAPSRDVLIKLVEWHNRAGGRALSFLPGSPSVEGGCGKIRVKCPSFLRMAASGQYTLVLTDLDRTECAVTRIRDWFFSGQASASALPKQVMFRVAVREVEAWLMADKEGFSQFLGISPANFVSDPESLPDPKRFLLDVVERKAGKKKIREMLPTGRASIGVGYNKNLCEFIKEHWSIERASSRAHSLRRAVAALGRIE